MSATVRPWMVWILRAVSARACSTGKSVLLKFLMTPGVSLAPSPPTLELDLCLRSPAGAETPSSP